MTTYQRVKRWREKHRDEYNSKRRKENLSGGVGSSDSTSQETRTVRLVRAGSGESGDHRPSPQVVSSAPPAQPFPCMIPSSFIAESVDEPPPTIYRNSRGVVITKREWERQQAEKRKADEGNYSIEDEYSQL